VKNFGGCDRWSMSPADRFTTALRHEATSTEVSRAPLTFHFRAKSVAPRGGVDKALGHESPGSGEPREFYRSARHLVRNRA